MKSKLLIWTIGAMALCLMSACANGDVQRVQKAEELLTVNRDSAMAILREVVRPDQLPEESKALYWFCVADIRANALIDWPSIYQTIDLVYDGFYTRLVQKYGNVLNEKELQLCCLLKADFSTKEINMLTRQSLQTIYQRKTQVRQKLSLAEAEDITTAII